MDVLSRYLSRDIEENHEKLRIASTPVKLRTENPLNTRVDLLTTLPDALYIKHLKNLIIQIKKK
jgi:hypothetical protein